jgi:hypothetical protein
MRHIILGVSARSSSQFVGLKNVGVYNIGVATTEGSPLSIVPFEVIKVLLMYVYSSMKSLSARARVPKARE